MAYQQFLGQFAIGDSNDSLTIGANALSLTAGNYFMAGYTSETTAQLCEHLQAVIRAIGASQDSSTVAYSASTGLVTITLETAATLTFNDAALATLLGYTSTSYGSATSFVAERQPRYVWRPTRSAWDYPTNLTAATFWPPRSNAVVGRSKNGTTFSVAGHVLYDAVLTYRCLTEAEVKTPSTGTVYADLQQFWIDVVANGYPIRFYPDRSLSASTDLTTFVWGREDDETIGAFLDTIYRHTQPHNSLWDVEIPMMKYIS